MRRQCLSSWAQTLTTEVTSEPCFVGRLLSPVMVLRLQVMVKGPFADTGTRLQPIFACRSEMNAAVYSAQRRFVRCIETR
jgi:hypothetical protein